MGLNIETRVSPEGLDLLAKKIEEVEKANKKLNSQMDKVNKSLKVIQDTTKKVSAANVTLKRVIEKVTDGLIRLGTRAISSVISGFSKAIEASSEFNRALAEASTLYAGVVTDIEELRMTSLKLAVQYGQMPTNVVQAFYEAISAGATEAADRTYVLEAAGKLAVGGLTDMQTATRGLVSMMRAFGASFDQAGDYADTLFVGMQKGITRIPLLIDNLGKAAGFAKQAGLTFQEYVSAISAITVTGQNTEMAVVGLTNILKLFNKQSAEGAKLAEAFGLDLTNLQKSGRTFAEFLADLDKILNENKRAFAAIVPDIRGMRGALALLTNDGEGYLSIMQAMNQRMGMAREATDKVGRTFSQQAARVKASFNALFITLGDFLTRNRDVVATLEAFVTITGSLVTILASMTTHTTLTKEALVELGKAKLANMVRMFAKLLDAIAPLVGGFMDLASFIGKAAGNLSWLVRMATLATPGLNLLNDALMFINEKPSSSANSYQAMIEGLAAKMRAKADDIEHFNWQLEEGGNAIDVMASKANRLTDIFSNVNTDAPLPATGKPKLPKSGGDPDKAVKQLYGLPDNLSEFLAEMMSRAAQNARAKIAALQGAALFNQKVKIEQEQTATAMIDENNARAAAALYDQVREKGVEAGEAIAAAFTRGTDAMLNMILNGASLRDTLINLGKQAMRMAAQWIASKIKMAVVNKATDKAQMASNAALAANTKANAVSQAMAEGTVASVKGGKAVADVPIVGPALAIAAIAAIMAVVIGLVAGLNKGGVIPGAGPNRDSGLFAGTPGERVLSREQTESFDRLVNNLTGEGATQSSQAVNLTLNINGALSNGDRAAITQWVQQEFAPVFYDMVRNDQIGPKISTRLA